MRKRTSALAVMALATALVTVNGAGTAQAAERCTTTDLSIALPGNPDLEGYAKTCVDRIDSNTRSAKVLIQLEGIHISGGKRFHYFRTTLRLERNNVIIKSQTKPWTIGDGGRVHTTSFSFTSDSTATGGWSADGYIKYDATNDGKGEKRKDLKGSPTIR
jgi:hypothetical protein